MNTDRPLAAALAGVACISGSAVLMKLAGTSASVTALGRCALALPVLGVLLVYERRRGVPPLSTRARWLARLSGLFLAADLIVWSHSISAIGAGLGTVVPSLQVLFVSLLAWLIAGERPHRSLLFASPVMLAGLALVGGLTGARAYGTHPALGVAEGVAVAVLYSIFIFLLRQAASCSSLAPGTRIAGRCSGAFGLASAKRSRCRASSAKNPVGCCTRKTCHARAVPTFSTRL